MKSKASIKGHPIHPIIVGFPIAFFFGTLAFDVLGRFFGSMSFINTASYLEIAGIGSAVLAAIAGVIDYVYTVPPESSAKESAGKHGLLNTGILIIFSVCLYLRSNNTDLMIIIVLEFLGVVIMSISGWLGGTLVHQNQIGVDISYANAGKWTEQYFEQTSGTIEVATINELETDQMKLLHLKDKRIVLGKTAEGYVAFDDHCPHKGGSLAGGAMICGTVQCPWHGSQFNVNTGAVKAGPSESGINTFPVSTKGTKVFINL